MPANGVFTRIKRTTFVERISSEVGDGTLFPMLVTPDQLAEIFYRTNDAWLTGGSVTYQDFDATYEVSLKTDPPPTSRISAYQARGYYFADDFSDINPADAPYFDELFFDWPFDSSKYCRIMKPNERGMWLPQRNLSDGPMSLPETASAGINNPFDMRTAFSHSIYSLDNNYVDDGYYDTSRLSIAIGSEVAWVDLTGTGNPLDPLNPWYLQLKLSYQDSRILVSSQYINESAIPATDLVFELAGSGNSCSCKLYFYEVADFFFLSATPFVFTAKEWWPYAKGSPAAPVWNSTTGLKL